MNASLGDCLLFQQKNFNDGLSSMEEIRRQGKLCDVILKVGDVSISAHKVVLSASIPYFYAMFTGDMIESRQPEVEIQAIDADALQQLVNYAYTRKILLTRGNVESIFIGSAFLQLDNVKEACVQFLRSRFDPQNVIGMKSLGDSLSCPVLFESADQYISRHFNEVASSDEFLNISHADLASIIRRDDLHVDNEEIIFEAVMKWMRHNNSTPYGNDDGLADLLKLVRFPLITPTYLTDHVITDDFIKNSLKCRDVVQEAFTYHLLPERQPAIRTFPTEPRGCNCLCGQIYVVGGLTKSGDSLSTVECFNPTTKKWTLAPPMTTLRSRLGVAVLHGQLYAIGGYNGSERLSTVEVLDLTHSCWVRVSPMNGHRSALGAAALGKHIYVCGGYDGKKSLDTVERYCPKENKWKLLCPMNRSRSAGATVRLDGFIYALGGHDGLSIFDSVERYDPVANTWTEIKPMSTRRCRLGVAVLNGKIYACGGYDGVSFLSSVEVYDPQTDTWSFVASMNAYRSRVALTTNEGKLWAIGGYDGIHNLESVETYEPRLNKWQFEVSMMAHDGGVGVGVLCT